VRLQQLSEPLNRKPGFSAEEDYACLDVSDESLDSQEHGQLALSCSCFSRDFENVRVAQELRDWPGKGHDGSRAVSSEHSFVLGRVPQSLV